MNTATGYTRVNLTISKDIIEYLKHNTENMSKNLSLNLPRPAYIKGRIEV